MAIVTLLGQPNTRSSFVDGVLTSEQCKDIIDHYANISPTPAETQQYGISQPVTTTLKHRKGEVVLGSPNFPHFDTINKHVAEYLMLTGIAVRGKPQSQYTIYRTSGDHFQSHKDEPLDNHQDTRFFKSGQDMRKVSVSLHLSDPNDYTGCKLQFPTLTPSGKEIWSSYNQTAGSMVIFPSYWKHRVTALESGTRYSMVLWYMGKLWS
jgi:hypothetical protein